MIWGAFFMLKILIFTAVLLFAVFGAIAAFVLIYLKFCSPRENDGFFVISFYAAGSYILELKWLTTVFSFFGVNERVIFNVLDEGMSEEKRCEFMAVFGERKNIFLDEICPEAKKDSRSE